MSVDREQTIRIDCPTCHHNGYVVKNGVEDMCDQCSGSGMLEKVVPYKYETRGVWSRDELADQFGVEADAIRDSGHSSGDEE